MPKLASYSVGSPTQEKPGLWFVVVSAGGKKYNLYFDVFESNIVDAFYDSPELRSLFAGSVFSFDEAVTKGYRILQDHIAPDGQAAYSWSYRMVANLIQRQFGKDAAAIAPEK